MKVDDYKSARASIVNAGFFETRKWVDQKLRANRLGAHEQILEFERKLIARLQRMNIPMFAHCVIRTQAEQEALYVQGHTKARAGKSPHQHGMAVDIVHSINGWDIHKRAWSLIGHIGKEVASQNGIKIRWGGDWKFYDPAHWELENWRNRYVGDAYEARLPHEDPWHELRQATAKQ